MPHQVANYQEGCKANDQANKIDISEKRSVACFFADEISADSSNKVVSKHFFKQTP